MSKQIQAHRHRHSSPEQGSEANGHDLERQLRLAGINHLHITEDVELCLAEIDEVLDEPTDG